MTLVSYFVKYWKFVAIPRWLYRSRKIKSVCTAAAAVACLVFVYVMATQPYLRFIVFGGHVATLDEINEQINAQIQKSVLKEKGTGCKLPPLDPYSEEATAFFKDLKDTQKIVCRGTDWVNCHKAECSVEDAILRDMREVVCTYSDIVYVDDHTYHIAAPVSVAGAGKYVLNTSDHVKISCTAKDVNGLGILSTHWYGHKAGFRPVPLKPRLPKRRDTFNVMVLAFDSASHNGFLRSMPKSYKYLNEDLHAVILNSYSIVGDATTGALYPVFTGKSETEQPDSRKTVGKERYIDHTAFIFHHLKQGGYRTAYLEDMPWIGTFQYRFKGFRHQPADHYLRSFYIESYKSWRSWWDYEPYCIGAVPSYQLLLDLSSQFLDLDGKKFCFTFIADISHDDFNMITNADDATVSFLKSLVDEQRLVDTLVIVMGDHGSRFDAIRNTYQGRLEERLPLMAIILPEKLKKLRPDALEALRHNRDVLTTHFDLHATLLDVVDLKQHVNNYTAPGADIPRAMSLLEKIPRSRSCGEAGVAPHWCVCTQWHNVSSAEPRYRQVAKVLAEYIDGVSDEKRDKCAIRKLISIVWVMRQGPNEELLKFPPDVGHDGLENVRTVHPNDPTEYYQAKIIMSPGRAVFEGTMVYDVKMDYFFVSERDISRTSAYGDEPACVSATHPHLNKFCYCKDKLGKHYADRSSL